MSESRDPGDGTQAPPARNTRRGVVTKVYPHTTPDDNSNYEVDVRLVDGGPNSEGSQASDTHTRIPVEVSAQGEVRGIETEQLVNVAYYENNAERPYVSGVAYSLEDRAPLAHEGDWRQRHDESVLESIRMDDGGRKIRIGHQSEDRDDLDAGLHIDTESGAFEIYDSEGNGLCCDGDGNVVLSNVGEVSGALTGSAEESTAPVETSSNTSSGTEPSSIRPDTSDSVTLGPGGYAPTPSSQSLSTETVDLSTQDLAEGDVIDPYLEEYFTDDTTLYLPSGTYTWNGSGLSGDYENAELVGGVDPAEVSETDELPRNPGQTTFTRSDDWTGTAAITCDGGGEGSVGIRNLTITGANGADPAFTLSVTDPAASMVFDSVHLPDGDTTNATGAAILVEGSHVGTLHLRNLFVQDFRNGGVDASSPGQPDSGGMRGRTIVAGGLFRDNNIANLRISGIGSEVRQVTSIQTGSAPGPTGSNPRSVWLSDYVEATMSDCDVVYQDSKCPAVVLGAGAEQSHAEGFLDSNRIQNDHSDTIVNVVSGEWSGSGNHFTGSGNLTPSGGDFAGTCTGSGCETPDRTPREIS